MRPSMQFVVDSSLSLLSMFFALLLMEKGLVQPTHVVHVWWLTFVPCVIARDRLWSR